MKACVLALVTMLSAQAYAAEMRVHGEVVNVVPVTGAAPEGPSPNCQPPRPQAGAGLVELLSWDLRVHCPPAAASVTGYRVFYRWDGHTYSRVMREPPGATVPLRVRLD